MEITSPSMNGHYPTAMRVGAGRIRELGKCCGQADERSPVTATVSQRGKRHSLIR